MYKKLISFSIIYVFCTMAYALSLNDLVESSFRNNGDVIDAQNKLTTSHISNKLIHENYFPEVSFSSTFISSMENDDFNSFNSSIKYIQTFPGNTKITLEGTYYCKMDFLGNDIFYQKTPYLCLNIEQSLLPFWLQGSKKDPLILMNDLQNELYYYQLLNIKKEVLKDLLINYVNALVYEKKISIYKNINDLLEEQIAVMNELRTTGSINLVNIIQLENSKWNNDELLLSAKSNYVTYINNLIALSGMNFGESNFTESIFLNDIQDILHNNEIAELMEFDPMEKIFLLKLDILKENHIFEKQKSSPIMELIIRPSWEITVGFDLSPCIKSPIKSNNQCYELDLKLIEQNYETSVNYRNLIRKQYQELLDSYILQSKNILVLLNDRKTELSDYEKQYKMGMISKLDYQVILTEVENCELSKSCIDNYIWLYKSLLLFL